MSAVADYPLQRDTREHARLDAQAQFWAPDTAALLADVPLEDAQVADLGCGTLHVARALQARVGERGRVHAIDNDPALLKRLRAETGPIELRCADAFDTGLPAHSLAAAHARFVAAPCGRLDALLAEMLRLVRPGGWLILQEPDAESWAIPAAGRAWLRLKALIRAGFKARGGDFDAGTRLASTLAHWPVEGVRLRQVVHRLPSTHPYARLPLAFARSLQPLWRAEGLADEAEVAEITAAVEDALARPGKVSTFTLVQALATVGVP